MQKKFEQTRLGAALRSARKHRAFNQQTLATKAGVSVPTVRALENRKGNLSSFTKCLIALQMQVAGRQLPPGEHLGKQLAILRRRRRLSQRNVATLAKITQPTLVQVERRFIGRLAALERLLAVLAVEARLHPVEVAQNFYSHAGTSSAHHGWHSPPEVMKPLYQVFGRFDLDPCSPVSNPRTAPVKTRACFAMNYDGLALDWFGIVYLNPPYGRSLPLWLKKARQEVEAKRASSVIALIPARPETNYWHEHIAACARVWFLKGRLTFGGADNAAPFPSALVAWGLPDHQAEQISKLFPTAWAVYG